MAIPTSYLLTTKRLSDIFDAMRTAKAPERFSIRFIETLGFKSKTDRLLINVLKSIGFLDETGKPLDRYFRFLDQSQSAIVLAEGVNEAYQDLFEINTRAHELSKTEVAGKLKTLTQGQYSDLVLSNMSMTFLALCELSDFKTAPANLKKKDVKDDSEKIETKKKDPLESNDEMRENNFQPKPNFGGLVYNIQIVLPETRDPKVYDAIFKSLKEHLLG